MKSQKIDGWLTFQREDPNNNRVAYITDTPAKDLPDILSLTVNGLAFDGPIPKTIRVTVEYEEED